MGVNGASFEGLPIKDRLQLFRQPASGITLHLLRMLPPLHTKEGIRSARPITQREAADEVRKRLM